MFYNLLLFGNNNSRTSTFRIQQFDTAQILAVAPRLSHMDYPRWNSCISDELNLFSLRHLLPNTLLSYHRTLLLCTYKDTQFNL